jgi:hypothetical protein
MIGFSSYEEEQAMERLYEHAKSIAAPGVDDRSMVMAALSSASDLHPSYEFLEQIPVAERIMDMWMDGDEAVSEYLAIWQ